MDWDKLRIFHAVAEAGSFTHAGDTLGLSQSAVSRQIQSLEDSLGVFLFHRHARGLLLTEQGEGLNRTVRDVFSKLAMAEAKITERKDRPQGPLKITTTVAFGSTWLTPQLKEFMDLYPEIELSLILLETELDLGMREADCAIRFNMPRQPDLIRRRLKTVRSHLYASPDYLREHGVPHAPEDLLDHHLVVYGEDTPSPVPTINWLLHVPALEGRAKPNLKLNNIYGIYRAVVSGAGIGALPSYMTRLTNNLARVVPELVGPDMAVHFVYPEELSNSKRIAVFRDFLASKIAGIPLV